MMYIFKWRGYRASIRLWKGSMIQDRWITTGIIWPAPHKINGIRSMVVCRSSQGLSTAKTRMKSQGRCRAQHQLPTKGLGKVTHSKTGSREHGRRQSIHSTTVRGDTLCRVDTNRSQPSLHHGSLTRKSKLIIYTSCLWVTNSPGWRRQIRFLKSSYWVGRGRTAPGLFRISSALGGGGEERCTGNKG